MKKISFVSIFIAGLIGTFFILRLYSPATLPKLGELQNKIEEVKKEVFAPPPLRASQEYETSFLTRAGVLKWTNIQRANNGSPGLTINTELNTAASLRAKDMFENQYFAHVSPTGKDAEHLVDCAGYEFIMIGENLALGNFKDDEALVQAWMNSPGHRANLLNYRFQEIGISVLRGTFEGRSTWIAVQIFGRPVSACPQADTSLKSEVESTKLEINSLKGNLDSLAAEINSMHQQRGPEYNMKIEEYNKLVSDYNDLLSVTKNLVLEYNNQVKLSNLCISGS